MFAWMQTLVAPFVIACKGRFYHDTITMVIPPTEAPIDISYIPDPKFKTLVIGLTFGTPMEYDPDTGTVGPEILTADAGVYHSAPDYMDLHWDPFVESILKTNPYPQLLWSSTEKPYFLRIVNRTDKYIWCDVTFWIIKFPRTVDHPVYGSGDPEEIFRKYMEDVLAVLAMLRKILPKLQTAPEVEIR